MSYIPTLTLLTAIKTKLAALKLTDEAEAENLFQRVEFYGSQDLGKALQDLTITQARLAFIVPAGDSFENDEKANTLVSRMVTAVDVLIADRTYGAKPHGGHFSTPKNPGTVAMKDRVLPALVGTNLDTRGVCLIPTGSETLEISDPSKKDAPGRQVWLLSFETRAGDARASNPP